MSGAELLAEARVWVPDAVRVLLTGEADLSAVVAAVNEGHIRHYLSKPVERDELRRFIQRAFEEHDEALAERKHRSASVRGGAQLALAVLKTSDPVAAARAERSAATAAQLASAAGLRCADDAELATWLAVVAERLPAGAGDPSLDVLLGETEGQVRMALHENANPTPGRSLLAKVVAGALALDDFAQGRTSLNECQQALGEPLTGFAGGLGLLTRPANVA